MYKVYIYMNIYYSNDHIVDCYMYVIHMYMVHACQAVSPSTVSVAGRDGEGKVKRERAEWFQLHCVHSSLCKLPHL